MNMPIIMLVILLASTLLLCNKLKAQTFRVDECIFYNEYNGSYEKQRSKEQGFIKVDFVTIMFKTDCFDKTINILNTKKQAGFREFVLDHKLKTTFTINESEGKAELVSEKQYRITFKIQRI